MIPPILCYHKVDTRLELGFTRLGPRAFRRQIDGLAKAGYRGIGSAELAEGLRSGLFRHSPHASREVVITFDDAYSGLDSHALPVLADHGFKALLFVITDFVGRENTWDVQYGWQRFHHLDWDQLGRWSEKGMEVQSHGRTHARMTWQTDAQVADEMESSREKIVRQLGKAPTAISYPFGAADARVRAHAVNAGYTLGFGGPRQDGVDPLLLPRQPVYPWDLGDVPFVLREDALGEAARGVARFTNACAVGTAFFQKVLRRRY